MYHKLLILATAILALFSGPVESQIPPSPPALSYADLADLAVAAPIAAHVRVKDADMLRAEEAPTVPAGHRRFLIEAEIVALIRGQGGIEGPVTYVVDLANDSRGRPARIERRAEYLIMA